MTDGRESAIVPGNRPDRRGYVGVNANTFAGQLKHFAKSVDIVDDDVFDRVRQLIYKYVRGELQAEYFEVDRAQEADGETGLRMFWSSEDHDHIWRLQNADKSYLNCVTRAFALGQPMWIVASDKAPLADAGEVHGPMVSRHRSATAPSVGGSTHQDCRYRAIATAPSARGILLRVTRLHRYHRGGEAGAIATRRLAGDPVRAVRGTQVPSAHDG